MVRIDTADKTKRKQPSHEVVRAVSAYGLELVLLGLSSIFNMLSIFERHFDTGARPGRLCNQMLNCSLPVPVRKRNFK